MIDLSNISYTQESSVLVEGEMSFSYVVEEGPSEEVVLECNESKNMKSNMCENLSTCTYFEERFLGQAATINLDSSVSQRLR